ncbi:MAG: 30S ribosomal protein S17 [Bacillus subtilis]|nr:30S ribosomal protein S17 [Bacillus subtilis]
MAAETEEEERGNRSERRQGKADPTRAVVIERQDGQDHRRSRSRCCKQHPLYKKYLTRSKRIQGARREERSHEGDTVRVVECRPLSRDKRWRLAEIVEKAK